ncbi:MAG: hypothetical protein EBT00_15335 [Proteobacteria bacterium]|nr:hypothetical protein [Pseudomonadota bacterium]
MCPLVHTVDPGVDGLDVVLVVDEGEVETVTVGAVDIDLEVYLLVARGGVHELGVSGPSLTLQIVGVGRAGGGGEGLSGLGHIATIGPLGAKVQG